MDIKRNLLLVALAVVSYLLLLAWNNDYPPQIAGNPELPVLEQPAPNAGAASDDLPQVQAAGAPAQPNAATNRQSAQLITVRTPTQVVIIDPVGGDIVELRLPRFPTSLEAQDDPFVLMHTGARGTYVAQSGLLGGVDNANSGRPRYQSAQSSYELAEGELNVDLIATVDNLQITKRFIFSADDYLIRVQYLVDNNGTTTWNTNLFAQLKRDQAPDPSSAEGFGINTYLGAVQTTPDDPYAKVEFEEIADGVDPVDMQGGWIGFSQHYFLGSWIAPTDLTNTFTVRQNTAGEYLMGFVSGNVAVPAGETTVLETALWAGPKDQYRLETIAPNLGLTIDYGMLWFVGYPIFWLLTQINLLVGNYGWSIILLTVVIRLLFYPLSAKQYRSQATMKRLQPKITQLKERYGDDKQKFMQAQMELWKKEKVNPFSGCLPVLLQMPVFLGIYWVLNESVELRQAPFILWYRDLSAMDAYFVLPLLLGAAYYLQQHMTPMMVSDPMQARVMKFMPVIFTVFFLWFPAGLVLYYLVNALLGILQQWYFSRKLERTAVAANDSD